MNTDLVIQETGDGGDVSLLGNDLELTQSLFNMPYLGLFGGNTAQNTDEVGDTGLRFDYWGNQLLFQDLPELQFNSRLERTLESVALNSQGRTVIEDVVKQDLAFMEDFASIEVNVSITGFNRAQIEIIIQEPDNLEEQNFIFLWDGTKVEQITEGVI